MKYSITSETVEKGKIDYENFIDVCGCDSKIKATYKACLKFIQWYNQQQN